MTTLKDKVIESFQRSNEDTVTWHLTNDELGLEEVTQGIVELVELGIHPKFKVLDAERLEIKFFDKPQSKLQVGAIVKLKNEKTLHYQERELDNKFFVKQLLKRGNGYEVTLAQFAGELNLAICLYDETIEALEANLIFVG